MVIEYARSTTITLPNITVEEVLQDGVVRGYRLTADEGYVVYDTAANDVEPKEDPETGDYIFDEDGNIVEVPVIHYFRQVTVPVNLPLEKWSWRAVREETAAEVS